MTADLSINIKYHGVPDKHREELEQLTLEFLRPLVGFFPGLVTFEVVPADECPTCGLALCVLHPDSIFFGRDLQRPGEIDRARQEALDEAD